MTYFRYIFEKKKIENSSYLSFFNHSSFISHSLSYDIIHATYLYYKPRPYFQIYGGSIYIFMSGISTGQKVSSDLH